VWTEAITTLQIKLLVKEKLASSHSGEMHIVCSITVIKAFIEQAGCC